MTGPLRFPLVPWGDLELSDLREMGDPELIRDTRVDRQIGLHIRGQYVGSLGLLAIRCERKAGDEHPIGMAIAETPPFIDTEKPAMDMAKLRRVDMDYWREGEGG